MLKEPSNNQINLEFGQKFVKSYNFKRGRRRKFFLFSEDQDLAGKPKSVCPLCKPIKKSLLSGSKDSFIKFDQIVLN